MATLSSFYPYVLPDVSGCPEITVDVAIRSALIEFCEKSLVVQRDHDPITVVAGVIDYELEPPTGQIVTKVMKAWYKNVELSPIAPDNVLYSTVYNTLWSGASKTESDPRNFLQKEERSITIYPFPKETEANALTMRVALKPSRKATTFEEILFEDYAEIIAFGAKYRLLSLSGKGWTNGPAASVALAKFSEGVNLARARASTGGTRGAVRVKLTGV